LPSLLPLMDVSKEAIEEKLEESETSSAGDIKQMKGKGGELAEEAKAEAREVSSPKKRRRPK